MREPVVPAPTASVSAAACVAAPVAAPVVSSSSRVRRGPAPAALRALLLGLALLLPSAFAPSAFTAAAYGQVPADALRLRTQGVAELENERPSEAEATFKALAAKTPKDPLPHANLAIAQLRQQRYDEALASIDRALKLAPKRGDLLTLRAEILKWAGKGQEALASYRAAAAAAPEYLEAVFGLYRHAESLTGDEAASAANVALDQLGRLRPDNLLVMLRLGSRAIARGDRAEASRAFLRVRELAWQAPPVAAATLDKVLEALEAGEPEKARIPALRLENVLKITPMYQQGQRELTEGIQGNPVVRFEGEPAAGSFGKPLDLSFRAGEKAASESVSSTASGDFNGDDRPDTAWLEGGTLKLRLQGKTETAQGPTVAAARGARLLPVDLDNDAHLDLLVYGASGVAYLKGDGAGGFSDATSALGLAGAKGTAAAAFDYDVDGDLDLFLAGGGSGGGGARLFRNALTGPLEDVSTRALPDLSLRDVRDAAVADLDRDGDLDLLVAHGGGLTWLDNLRQGELADRTREGGLAGASAARAVAVGDFDNDGRPDVASAGSGLSLWRSREGGFVAWNLKAGVPPGRAVDALEAADFDNDGRLDLALAGPEGTAVLGQQAAGGFSPWEIEGGPAVSLAAADLDGDGDLDLAAAGPSGLRLHTNEGGSRNHYLSVRLKGLATGNGKNNVLGRGAVLELRAGGAYQYREMTGDVAHFGLGSLTRADNLRVVWTNGVPQNRIGPKADQRIVEEQVLKGSCPFLYAWDGEEVRFVTDLLWGAPIGLPVAEGVWARPDPRELVAVPFARPRPDGRYDLRITEELWEAAFFDEVRLWVVDHPEGVETASSLKIVPGEEVPEAVLGSLDVRPVAAAWDGRGEEVTERVARRDEVYADGYEVGPYQGVSKPWHFTFDLGAEAARAAEGRPIRLLLDGWIFPADASLNLAVDQRGDFPYLAPRLEIQGTDGAWREHVSEMGHPAGKTKTMVVDVPPLPPGVSKLRITTSLWLAWDRVAWTPEPDDAAPRRVARLSPETADLAFRGFSRLVRRAPNAPHVYDYSRTEAASPWLPFPGAYTRFGDVRELLREADDRMVILAPGDEMRLTFDASRLAPPAPGMRRTVFLESFGWDKDADRNTYEAARVEPLPFGAMGGYPYPEGTVYPDTPELREYRREWLTRMVPAAVGPGSETGPGESGEESLTASEKR